MSGKWEFRDVSLGLRIFRDILLGRAHIPHNRFPPFLASRTLPTPDIPRGPEYKYSNQYYYKRNPIRSVHPPVVAPIALSAAQSTIAGAAGPKSRIQFPTIPAPGPIYWWDNHGYYEEVPDTKKPCPPPPQPDPCAPKKC
ncbi:uncharacterized protein LOC142979743 [Anticarsia gemmatalis]|uniref:uncharacterized protein LOC142979743 n=1 Tax=Anticarsia gemmatalis TaxID=129554 RepID=UPI003F76F856